MSTITIPTYDSMMDPLLRAMKSLGGSGTIDEIENAVADAMGLSDEQLEVLQDPDKGGRIKFAYRLAWTRTSLKKYGILDNSTRGVWALTPSGMQTDHIDGKDVVRAVREQIAREKADQAEEEPEEPPSAASWREQLLDVLLEMEPSSFEKLIQRLLRESGFIQVEVTGRSGDGGIDGKGIMRLGGLLSFHVIFQGKRYKGSVNTSQVRDFRGAMVGRADKGLLITTGTFTKDAVREATRDGAPPIDLIDGDLLMDRLKELSVGVKTEVVETEKVSIDQGWFLAM